MNTRAPDTSSGKQGNDLLFTLFATDRCKLSAADAAAAAVVVAAAVATTSAVAAGVA